MVGRIATGPANLAAATEEEAALPALYRYSPADGCLADQSGFDQAYAEAVASEQQPTPPQLPVSRLAAASPIPLIGLVLGVLGLRDIKRANGMLRGELLAHLAILAQLSTLATLAVIFWVISAATGGSVASAADTPAADTTAYETNTTPVLEPPATDPASPQSDPLAGSDPGPPTVAIVDAAYIDGESDFVGTGGDVRGRRRRPAGTVLRD